MQKRVIQVIAFMLLIISTSFAQDNKSLNFNAKGYYPEGVAFYEAEKLFLVSSLTNGIIGAVDAKGNFSTFIQDEAIISSIGLKIDQKNHKLYVANSDVGVSTKTQKATQAKLASLLVYDLKTKKRIANYKLSNLQKAGNHFANDIAIDNQGNCYITDSFSPNIYKVSATGNISIFATNELFKVAPNAFGLNGIVWNSKGFLVVSHYDKGVLFKVPTSNPSNITEIKISTTIKGADGLQLFDNGQLAVIANNSGGIKSNMVFLLEGNADWTEANIKSIIPVEDVFPTTATLKKGKLFILHGYLDRLFTGQPAVNEYSIQQIEF